MLKGLVGFGTHVVRTRTVWGPVWYASALATKRASSSALLGHIRTKILMRGGPLSISEYMQDCLTSPHGGFYMTRDVFGSSGDFVTSPEISQLFGEMVGIWCVHTWMSMGRHQRLQLVELGPGRGTLMADLLRGTAAFPEFSAALEVHLVEISPALRALQWATLRCSSSSSSGGGKDYTDPSASRTAPPDRGLCGLNGCQVYWHASLDAVPDGPAPALYVAHEFFDALPVHQFIRDPKRGWLEKMVDVQPEEDSEELGTAHHGTLDSTQDMGHDPNQDLKSGHGSTTHRFEALRVSPTNSSTTPASAGFCIGADSPADSSNHKAYGVDGPTSIYSSKSSARRSDERLNSDRGGCAGEGTQPLGSNVSNGLRLVLSPGPTPAAALLVPRRLSGLPQEEAQALAALEVSAVGMATAERLAHRIGRHGGAALVVDYGREAPPYGDSLMAIRAHRGVGVLDSPGSADLSAWVDFGALKMAAEGAAAASKAANISLSPLPSPVGTTGPVSQAAFLRNLGIETRLQWLASRASDRAAAAALVEGCARLLGNSDEGGMGSSYQVMAIHQADLQGIAGF